MADEQFGWARAFRDILVRTIDRGQFPFAAMWIIALTIILKMPGESIVELMRDVFARLVKWELVAYVLFLGTVVGWFLHYRYMRKQYHAEFDRIGREKTKVQEQLARLPLAGSTVQE